MPSGPQPILYIRLRKRIQRKRNEEIRLGEIAQLIAEPRFEAALDQLFLCHADNNYGDMLLIDMMLIVSKVREKFPNMQIEHFGEPHTLVEMIDAKVKPNIVLTVFVWLLLFIGSGLAIMNFHADVSMPEVHRRIYKLVTGEESNNPLWLQIPYSIGIGAGMVLFFNHLFKKKINEEPSPLEVEMFMYEENIHRYIIADEYSEMAKKGERK